MKPKENTVIHYKESEGIGGGIAALGFFLACIAFIFLVLVIAVFSSTAAISPTIQNMQMCEIEIEGAIGFDLNALRNIPIDEFEINNIKARIPCRFLGAVE